jgi:hypothetical protein
MIYVIVSIVILLIGLLWLYVYNNWNRRKYIKRRRKKFHARRIL